MRQRPAALQAWLVERMYWGDDSSVPGGFQTSLTVLKYRTKKSLGLLVPLRVYKTFLVD